MSFDRNSTRFGKVMYQALARFGYFVNDKMISSRRNNHSSFSFSGLESIPQDELKQNQDTAFVVNNVGQMKDELIQKLLEEKRKKEEEIKRLQDEVAKIDGEAKELHESFNAAENFSCSQLLRHYFQRILLHHNLGKAILLDGKLESNCALSIKQENNEFKLTFFHKYINPICKGYTEIEGVEVILQPPSHHKQRFLDPNRQQQISIVVSNPIEFVDWLIKNSFSVDKNVRDGLIASLKQKDDKAENVERLVMAGP